MSKEKAHAKYAPSSMDRTVACPGWHSLADKLPKGVAVESPYAAEGTQAHDLLEKILTGKPWRPSGYPADMIEIVKESANEILAIAKKEGGEGFVETKSDCSFIDPNYWGTSDYTIVVLFGRLTVIDFKYGAGIAVFPKDNEQMLSYALGKAHEHDYNFSEIQLIIIQPRAYVGDDTPTTRTWVAPMSVLKKFAKTAKNAIEESKTPRPSFKTGDHCRFCPAKIICPEQSTKALAQAQIDFDEDFERVNLPSEIKELIPSGEKLGNFLNACDKIENWIGAMREHAFHQLNKGAKIPGWKLVEKRSTRKWVDAAKVEKLVSKRYGEKAFSKPELLSPAQLEKVVGKEFVSMHVSKVSSGFTLAREDDSRAGTSRLESDFKNL